MPTTKEKALRNSTNKRRGAVLVLVAITIPLFLLLAAFAINVAYMELTRTELQISSDAAARAGSRTYANTGDANQARTVARDAARRNTVADQPLLLADADIEFGVSSRGSASSRYTFSPSSQFNALRVVGRRTQGSPSGPVALLLPSLLPATSFEPTLQATSTQVELDIVLVLDRSGSMAYADNENSNTFSPPAAAPAGWAFGDAVPAPSRWDDAVFAVDAFLDVLDQTPQTELVSLATYGDNAVVDVALDSNYQAIRNGMDNYTQSFSEAMTNIGGGIDAGRNSITTDPNARNWAGKVIVVLTDGIHNTGASPNSAARRARNAGATVYTVTFSDEANQSRMRRVASEANGQHYHAQSGAQLAAAFQDIARSLPTMIVE